MPIFHDRYDTPSRDPAARPSSYDELQSPVSSEHCVHEQLREETCSQDATDSTHGVDMDSSNLNQGWKPSMFNRVELIERIKRGNSPSWQQVQNVSVTSYLYMILYTIFALKSRLSYCGVWSY
jgi:hypothetical protein